MIKESCLPGNQSWGQSLSDGISLMILCELLQGNLPRNNREKLVLILWAIHILRNVPNGPPTMDDMVHSLVSEARKLKTI
jgi:hypothetical protein